MKLFTKLKKQFSWMSIWKTLPCNEWISAADFYLNDEFEKAHELYLAGLKRYDNHPARYCAMLDDAYCLFRLDQFDDAIKQLKSVQADLPNSKQAMLRLAYINNWIGNNLETVWTIRNYLNTYPSNDLNLILSLFTCLFDAKAPEHLLIELDDFLNEQEKEFTNQKALFSGFRAIIAYKRGRSFDIEEIANFDFSFSETKPLVFSLLIAKLLIEEAEFELARKELREAMSKFSGHPRTLSMVAESYLAEYQFCIERNDHLLTYAMQLATDSAKASAWKSPREIKLLAKIHQEFGDKTSAFLLASKAQELSHNYNDLGQFESLDEFVNSLSSGTIS